MQKILIAIFFYFTSNLVFAQNHYDSAFINLENMLKINKNYYLKKLF
jgi:hypothetical protein